MDALAAARLGDEVAHGFGLMAMVGGAVLGAVVGAVVVAATVATGGAALAIVAGSVAAGGLGLGQLVKGICTAASLPEPTTGKLVMGSSNIRINSRAAMRASVDMAGVCSGIPLNHYPWPAPLIAEGSATVRFNGKPAARLSSKMVCGAHIKSGSGNVRIGGPTVRTNFVWDAEQWTEWALIGLGLGALGVAGRAAWVAGKWLGVGKFGAMLGLGFGGFELLGQIGDRLGPGYRDILQGAAGVVLLGLTPKLVKGRNLAAEEVLGAPEKAVLSEINLPPRQVRSVDSSLAKVADTRQALNIGVKRNIAFAEYTINGESGELIGISGNASRPGTAEVPTTRLFQTIKTGNNDRMLDSEVKILETLASKIPPNAVGDIHLFSELPLCISCQGVVPQFQQAFPGIRLVVTHGPGR